MVFCLFGVIGNCKEETSVKNTIKMQTEVSQKIIENNFTQITSEMKATSVNINRIVARSRGDIIIENVTMDQVAELKADGKIKMEMSVKADTVISTMVDAAAKVALEIENKNTGGNRSTYTSAEKEAITYLKSELIKNTTTNLFSSCVASVLNTNEIDVETTESGRNIIIKGIIMKQVSSLASKCVMNTFLNQISKVQTNQQINKRLEDESKITNKGLLDGPTALIIGAAAVFLVVIVIASRNTGTRE